MCIHTGNVVYPAAGLGVILAEDGSQTFFNEHVDDVLALAMSPDRTKVCTGSKVSEPGAFLHSTVILSIYYIVWILLLYDNILL